MRPKKFLTLKRIYESEIQKTRLKAVVGAIQKKKIAKSDTYLWFPYKMSMKRLCRFRTVKIIGDLVIFFM